MKTIKIKVFKNGNVTHFTENELSLTLDQAESTIRDAVELVDEPTPKSNELVTPHYNFDTDPVEITYVVSKLELIDRQLNLINYLKDIFTNKLIIDFQQQAHILESEYDTTLIVNLKLELTNKVALIQSATTHEELDLIQSTNQLLTI